TKLFRRPISAQRNQSGSAYSCSDACRSGSDALSLKRPSSFRCGFARYPSTFSACETSRISHPTSNTIPPVLYPTRSFNNYARMLRPRWRVPERPIAELPQAVRRPHVDGGRVGPSMMPAQCRLRSRTIAASPEHGIEIGDCRLYPLLEGTLRLPIEPCAG